MSSLPTRATRASKQHNRKPYERPPPSPASRLTRSKSSFFNTVKALVSAPFSWISGADSTGSAGTGGVEEERERQLKRRASRNRLENGARPKRLRTVSPQRSSAPNAGYLDPPENMLRSASSFATVGRSSKLGATSDIDGEHTQLSVRSTPLAFSTYHHPPRSPSRRTPSIGAWFPQPTSTRNSLAPRGSQAHFGTLPNLNIDAAIASYDDSRMQSRSPSVGVGVGLGRERTPGRSMPGREASLSVPLTGRMSLSRATGSSLRASLSAANPFSSLGKSSSATHERKKSNLVWDDTLGVTSVEEGKPEAPSAPPVKNTAERLLNALENMHTHTGEAQRPRRRPPPYVQVPTPGPSVPGKLKRMIQPYGEVKVSPSKGKKAREGRPKSGLMKMLMKNRKEVQEDGMDIEEAPKSAEPKEPAPVAPAAEKAEATVKDVDADMEPQSVPASTTTAASPALKVIDNFRPASQPPSRPGSSLRQSKTITKRAHAPSAGRNRFSANNEDEEVDEEAIEKRNAELLAVANANVFKVPEGFKFGGAPTPPLSALKPAEPPKADVRMDVVSPQPIPANSNPTAVLSFTPLTSAPAKEVPSPTPTFFSDKSGAKPALPEIKNPFANLSGAGGSKPEIKVPEVPNWGSAPSSSASTPPPRPTEGASPFAKIGVPTAKDGATPFSLGKPKEDGEGTKSLFGGKPGDAKSDAAGTPSSTNPFANVGKPTGDSPFGGASKPASENPFASIGTSNNTTTPTALPFSFGSSKPDSTPAPVAPAPTFSFGKPASEASGPTEAPKPVEAPKPAVDAPTPVAEAPKPVFEAPKPAIEAPKPSTSPFSFGASQPAEKPAAPTFSFGTSAATPSPASVPAPAPSPAPAPAFSFGTSTAPVPAPAAPTIKPTFNFGLPANTPSPTAEAPKKNPFDLTAPAQAAQPEPPKKSPFDFSSSAPAASTSALAPATSKSPFDFSSTAKPDDKPAAPFTFGTPGAPAAPEKKSPFDFSGTSQKPASSTFPFGAPSTSNGSTTNGFTFGTSAPAPARATTPPSGGDAAMEESPTREPTKIVTSGPGFGTGFGSQQPSTGFMFGSTTNGASTTTGPFGGPLNGASTNQSNGFGSAAPSSPAPFTFGASNNNTGSGFGGSGGLGTNGGAPSTTAAFNFGAGGGFGQTSSATASPSNPFTQPSPSPFGQPNPTPTNAFPTPASPFPAASPALGTVGFNTNNSGPSNTFGSTQPASSGFPASPAIQPQPAFGFGSTAPTAGTASPSTLTFGLPAGTSAPNTPTGTTAPFVFGQGAAGEGSPAPGVQFNLGTAEASPGGRKIKPLRRTRRG